MVKQEYNTDIEIDNVLATQGVSSGIVSTLALVKERGGTQVGIIEPLYTYHIFQIRRLYGNDVPIRYVPLGSADSGFAPNWEDIENQLKGSEDQAKLDILIVCNPSNPTGRVWTKAEMQRLVALTKKHDCVLLLDECYSDMVWEPSVHYSPIEDSLEDHVIVARGFSKVLGCQSWRVGYAISSSATIAELMRVQDPIYICVPFLQHSLASYFSGHFEDFQNHKKVLGELIQSNWKALSKGLEDSFGWKPLQTNGSMYGMLRHSEKTDMDAVKMALSKNIGVCPGSMFFADFPEHTGFVRIHCGVSKEKTNTILDNLSK